MNSPKARQVPPPPGKCDGQLYTVKATNTLYSIAQRFGITVQQIVAANPQIVNPNNILVDQVICIPNDTPTHNYACTKWSVSCPFT